MLLPKFHYHEPKALDEAAGLMGEIGEEASLLAGGTDLLVSMKRGNVSPKHLVYLSHIQELKTVARDHESLTIGACVTVAELREQEEIKADFKGLFEGAGSLGSPLIRNLATVGGNLVNARPAADLPPSLIAYDASIVLKKEGRERILLLEEFFMGPGQTNLQPGEILTRIVLPEPPLFSGGGYFKLGVRNALEISIVNVATFLALEGPKGPIREARIVLGSVAPKPLRASSAEGVLIGHGPGDGLFEKAGEEAAKDARPIDDFRASAAYRREMIKILTKKALQQAYEEIKLRNGGNRIEDTDKP